MQPLLPLLSLCLCCQSHHQPHSSLSFNTRNASSNRLPPAKQGCATSSSSCISPLPDLAIAWFFMQWPDI
jgi:hypothetical protein